MKKATNVARLTEILPTCIASVLVVICEKLHSSSPHFWGTKNKSNVPIKTRYISNVNAT